MAEARKMRSVAIIGAGPSGLISAHHLLSTGNFSVAIFEKTSQTCGLWPTSKSDWSRMIDPLMRANQSRHTVQFGATGQGLYSHLNPKEEKNVDIFPEAWQVGRYLERLSEEVRAKGAKIQLETEVVSVAKLNGSKDRYEDEGAVRVSDEEMRWRVGTRKTTSTAEANVDGDVDGKVDGEAKEQVEEEERIFDFVIIASGFFGTPKIPENLRSCLTSITSPPSETPTKAEMQAMRKTENPLGIPVIHSSHLRTLTTLLSPIPSNPPSARTSGKRKILIVGGSMSGCEIASAIASEISSLQYSPDTPALPNPSNYEIVHVASRPFYTLPRYLPLDASSSAPAFLPCDLVFNNLVNRRGTRGNNNAGHLSPEKAQKVHAFYRALSGQGKAHAWIEGDSETDAPWLAISDDYTTHALSGSITTMRGRLANLHRTGGSNSSSFAVITTPSGDQTINDVAAVILATGFSSTHSLSFLSDTMKEELGFREDSYMPLNLCWQSTVSKCFPSMGFVGMYNGPFWGVMELQALLLSSLWSRFWLDPGKIKEIEEQLALADRLSSAAGMAGYLRRMEEERGGEWRRKSCSQFPMGDYVHVVTDLLALRARQVDDEDTIPEHGCYPLVPDSAEVRGIESAYKAELLELSTSSARKAVQNTVDAGLAGAYYPRNLFRALLGKWVLNRTITSKHPSYPSGTLIGHATFYPRVPTSPEFSGEYLYDESGDFKMDNGLLMRASRRYVWRLRTVTGGVDELSQWFVKVSGEAKGSGVDYLFHELHIIKPDGSALGSGDGMNGAACPMTSKSPPHVESPEQEVRGGWASSLKAVDKAMSEVKMEEAKYKRDGGKNGLWTAKGHHLCIDDTYDPEYVFKWKGCELESWAMAYTVKGPGKDYFIESTFTRPS